MDSYSKSLDSTYQKNNLITQYAHLVKRIAYHLKGRLPACVQTDDLIQAGMMGLLDASSHYDSSKGASFETYAAIRIRGSMLDEIRKNDWAPRSLYRQARKIADAVHKIENHLGRDARDADIAKELELSLDEYHQLLNQIKGVKVLGFEDAGMEDDNIESAVKEPLSYLQRDHFQVALAGQISGLPERERVVLALYYEEELNLKEIGEVLCVSESRVCQIHAQAMVRLRSRMRDWTQEGGAQV